eukprot:6724060-Prorocentrum_lima.AAC.1
MAVNALLDTRAAGKAPTFDGSDNAWDEWAFKFSTWCGLLGAMEDGTRISQQLEAIERDPAAAPMANQMGPQALEVARA